MKVGYDGRSYSDQEYARILKVADIIVKKLLHGKPMSIANFFSIREYVLLSSQARHESLYVLCKKRGAIKLKLRSKSSGNQISFYAANVNDVKRIESRYELVSEVEVKSLLDELLFVLKEKNEMNMSELTARAHRFKKMCKIDRKNILDSLENDGLIKVRKIKNGRTGTILISLSENIIMTDKSNTKTKSEELIEQANKLLAAAEEAKKEEEKQLSKHEIMNIQREINVEIIEMEKQIDGMIDSFSKLKNLFDKLKQ